MTISEILSEIDRYSGKFARAAVEAAIAQKEEITPELLRILEDTINRAAELDSDDGYMGHIYSIFLLAQFREVRAYPLLIRIASLPDDLPHSLFGDIITEDYGRLLASVCGGDVEGIRNLIENESNDALVRGEAFTALLTLVAEGIVQRDAVVDYFAQLLQGRLERRPSEVWNALVAGACDLYPADLMDDIQQAYRDELVDPYNIGVDDVQKDIALGKDRVLARLASDRHHRMVVDTVKEMEWWSGFQPKEPQRIASVPQKTAIPKTTASPKVGRNEPCPCGSGKKYKKCCGA
jgi:hypothetical protein